MYTEHGMSIATNDIQYHLKNCSHSITSQSLCTSTVPQTVQVSDRETSGPRCPEKGRRSPMVVRRTLALEAGGLGPVNPGVVIQTM